MMIAACADDSLEALNRWQALLPDERIELTASSFADLAPELSRLPWGYGEAALDREYRQHFALCTLSGSLISKIVLVCNGPFWVQHSVAEAATVIQELCGSSVMLILTIFNCLNQCG